MPVANDRCIWHSSSVVKNDLSPRLDGCFYNTTDKREGIFATACPQILGNRYWANLQNSSDVRYSCKIDIGKNAVNISVIHGITGQFKEKNI